MARIVYKKGLEGQNKIECIEGIEIGMLNGQKALIYPKYLEKIMLSKGNIPFWSAIGLKEIEALKKEDNIWDTALLLRCGSPAADYINNFYSVKYGNFGLPTLLTAMEIQDQKNDIDKLSETIEGANLLCNFTNDIWTCSRYNDDLGWVAVSDFGFSDKDYLYGSGLTIPVILYK